MGDGYGEYEEGEAEGEGCWQMGQDDVNGDGRQAMVGGRRQQHHGRRKELRAPMVGVCVCVCVDVWLRLSVWTWLWL